MSNDKIYDGKKKINKNFQVNGKMDFNMEKENIFLKMEQ